MKPEKIPLFTVSELTQKIKDLLELNIGVVRVEGEISNLRRPRSGHCYFSLKDEKALLNCAIFKSDYLLLEFEPKEGMRVEVRGELSVYAPRGEYRLIVERMSEAGWGALYKAFLELKARLEKEGLFDPRHKRPLPFLPRRIGIVTSPTGAAIRDMLNILSRRFANLEVFIYPVRVQGDEAPGEIVKGIQFFNRMDLVEVLIVGRGGGSLEDLWAFNEEVVARAIFDSRLPVISAVGHETDFTIADFVADLRAPTPSAAAELVVKEQQEILQQLETMHNRILNLIVRKLKMLELRVEKLLKSHALNAPRLKLRHYQQRLDELVERVHLHIQNRLRTSRALLTMLYEKLGALNPRAILGRGYSIVYKQETAEIVKDASQLHSGDWVRLEFHKGKREAVIKRRPRRAPSAKQKTRDFFGVREEESP